MKFFFRKKKKEKSKEIKQEEDAIAIIVDRYLKNDLINNPLVPDFIERRIYCNILKLTLGVLKDTLEESKINVLDHEITFNIKPVSKSENASLTVYQQDG